MIGCAEIPLAPGWICSTDFIQVEIWYIIIYNCTGLVDLFQVKRVWGVGDNNLGTYLLRGVLT
jgi:hypothetical protein